MKSMFFNFIILLFSTSLFGQKLQFTAKKWEVLDIKFEVAVKSKTPLDIKFGAVFEGDDNQRLDIPGFYNDNNEWVLRFCPPSEQEWTFTTYSEVTSLAGITGKVNVQEKIASSHGPVKISPDNPQTFVYDDGTGYFTMAFELDWLFALDLDNEKDIPKTRQIISHVKENKFNQIVMNVYAYDAGWGDRAAVKPEYNFAKTETFPFKGTNSNPDYSALNIDFFKHLDRVMNHLNEESIISHLMIYVWNKKVNWPEADSKADDMYFDYVVKRYQAYPNLIWDISKEALAYGHDDMNYITRRIDRLRKLDGYNKLVTVHDYNYCNAFPEKVDFISIQEWMPNLYSRMIEVREKHSNKPIFNIEHGGYEKTMHSIFDGVYNDPLACLNRNYECAFAGSYSTYYWQNTSWYDVVYNPGTLPKENQPHFSYYKHLVSFFEKYNFNSLVPVQAAFTTYYMTNNDSLYIFYLPEDMLALAGEINELKGKTVKITWFDPLTGNYIEEGTREFKGAWIGHKKIEQIESPFCIAIIEIL